MLQMLNDKAIQVLEQSLNMYESMGDITPAQFVREQEALGDLYDFETADDPMVVIGLKKKYGVRLTSTELKTERENFERQRNISAKN